MDVVQLGAGITPEQLWFRRSNDNLVMALVGTDDKLFLMGWYNNVNRQVEQFRTVEGRILLSSQAENLVPAMAGLTPPALGTTSAMNIPALNQVIADAWY